MTALRFWRDQLVCLGSKNDLVVFSLESKRVHASYSPPGTASLMHVDHCLEFVLLGLQNGRRGGFIILLSLKGTGDEDWPAIYLDEKEICSDIFRAFC